MQPNQLQTFSSTTIEAAYSTANTAPSIISSTGKGSSAQTQYRVKYGSDQATSI